MRRLRPAATGRRRLPTTEHNSEARHEHHLVRHRPARQGHPATAGRRRPPAHQPDHEEQAPLSVGHSISPPPRDMWAAQSLIGLGSFSEAREQAMGYLTSLSGYLNIEPPLTYAEFKGS